MGNYIVDPQSVKQVSGVCLKDDGSYTVGQTVELTYRQRAISGVVDDVADGNVYITLDEPVAFLVNGTPTSAEVMAEWR